MTTLITGATGFVGATLMEELCTTKQPVHGFDLNPPPQALLKRLDQLGFEGTFHIGDTRDTSAVGNAIRASGATQIIHAATVTADEARDAANPQQVLSVNILGVASLFEAARDAEITRVIHTSSNAAYGRNVFQNGPILESTPSDPVSLYEVTKFAGERTALRLGALYGIDVRVARLSTVFGPWERATGMRDTLSPMLQVWNLAAAGQDALLPRPGQRDWIYVRDAASAIIALLSVAPEAAETFNIGPGPQNVWSVLSWGQTLEKKFPGFQCSVAQHGEVTNVNLYQPRDRAPLDISRLTAATGFAPAYDMEAAVADYGRFREEILGGI